MPYQMEIKSMFKKLVPVLALALLAGPAFAADAPATAPAAGLQRRTGATRTPPLRAADAACPIRLGCRA